MKHYVYKIIDPITNEFYIGSRSCDNISTDSYMGSYCSWVPTDSNRLVKEIIKSDFVDRTDANLYEIKLIKKYINNTLNRNYHIPGVGFHTYGRCVPIEQKEKQRNKMIGKFKGELHPLYGTKRYDMIGELNPAKTKEARQKISNHKSGKNNPMYGMVGILNKVSKPIIQYTKNGDFLQKWESANFAGNTLGINRANISSCCSNKISSAGGFKWQYEKEVI